MSSSTVSVCPIFQGFTVDEYEQVLQLLEQRTYPKGEIILHEGRTSQALWIVVKGSCEVAKRNRKKDEKQLATLEPGNFFGEMSFFQKAPHSATVRALTEVRVMRLSRESYDKLPDRCPSAAYKITLAVVSLMAQRLRRLDEWICELVERPEGASHRDEWHDFRAKLYADLQF
jgi:CRP/FNR family transcriptional regulator, cyclic AMP receptor protein